MNTSSESASKASVNYPPPALAWYMVGLLTVAYVFSFVDRIILGLLIRPIKDDLGLSDLQIGLLLGPAFAIFYATMGLPLGWLADRGKRNFIVAIGIALWSAATLFCGLAKNFAQLFVARMAVGVGEATLSPCAMSMISDSYPPERRGRPIAVYSSALALGSGIAYLGGAAVIGWAMSAGAQQLPWLGELAPWQVVFIVVGAPGLLLVLPLLMLRDPPRIGTGNAQLDRPGSLLQMATHVWNSLGMYASFASLFCFMTIVAYSHQWLPENFSRTWGWSTAHYSLYFGITILIVGPLAVNLAGWFSDRWTGAGRRDAPVMIAILGVAIVIPTASLGPLLPNAWLSFVVTSASNIGIGFISAVGVTALLNVVPPGIRAQTVALYYMAISFAGLFLGPTAVGLLNDTLFGEAGIRYSIALVPFVFGVPVLLLAPVTLKLYRKALQQ